MMKHLRGKGGLVAYLQTNNVVDVQMMIAQGREDVRLIFEASAYQIAKGVANWRPLSTARWTELC